MNIGLSTGTLLPFEIVEANPKWSRAGVVVSVVTVSPQAFWNFLKKSLQKSIED
jgi:hypothetical protein